MLNIFDEIKSLIESKKEGNYWDFKEAYTSNNKILIEDIVSMANLTEHSGNRYLIFGVKDKTFELVGIKDDINRKKEIDIINSLRDSHFSGDFRPEIKLETITIEYKEIDVLTIFDRPYKPYFLNGNKIRTRNGDRNDDADINRIEKMFRQRFGLDISPLERAKILLDKNEDWFTDFGNKEYCYHKQFPEYTIQLEETEKTSNKESYYYFYTDSNIETGKAFLKYHSTILYEFEYMWCDGYKRILPIPKEYYFHKYKKMFFYYILDNMEGKILKLFTEGKFILGDSYETSSLKHPYILFKDKDEKEKFVNYIESLEELPNIESNDYFILANDRYTKDPKSLLNSNPLFIEKIKYLFEIFRRKY